MKKSYRVINQEEFLEDIRNRRNRGKCEEITVENFYLTDLRGNLIPNSIDKPSAVTIQGADEVHIVDFIYKELKGLGEEIKDAS